VQAAGYAGAHVLQNEKVEKRDSCAGRHAVPRVPRTVQDDCGMLGEGYFWHAYRMPYESYWRLHSILATRITAARLKARQYLPKGGRIGRRGGRYKLPPICNGRISTSVRLACALRYFAGGSPYDIMAKYGISHTDVKDSVWCVFHAVNTRKSSTLCAKSSKQGLPLVLNEPVKLDLVIVQGQSTVSLFGCRSQRLRRPNG